MLRIQVDHDQRIILESSQNPKVVPQSSNNQMNEKDENNGKGGLFNESTNHLFHVMFHHPTTSPHSALGRLDGSATRDFTKASTTRR